MIEAYVAGLFGLLIGSFLNVCIYRLPNDLSVVQPRSFCPGCQRPVAWYDNVPLLSWVMLRGKCRGCRARISLRYPAVELLTGLWFFGAVALVGPTLLALKVCVYGAIHITLIFTDIEERILPDEFTIWAAPLGILLTWFAPGPPLGTTVLDSLMAGVLLSGSLWLVGVLYQKLRKKEGLGLGDVKMIAMIGAFAGMQAALLTMIAGSVAGSIVGLLYIWLTRKDAASYQLPFGTFLGLGALAVTVFEVVVNRYAV